MLMFHSLGVKMPLTEDVQNAGCSASEPTNCTRSFCQHYVAPVVLVHHVKWVTFGQLFSPNFEIRDFLACS